LFVRLLVQPGDGVAPLVKAIAGAASTVEIVIFRFDQREIERALSNAVSRGVAVRALIAHTNRAGEDSLRNLEMRLLEAGVVVARTSDDLARYHSKFMIIDHRELFLLAFNFTHADIERSRSFGIVTTNRDHVHEAMKLFEADAKRQLYEAGTDRFVVSPVNAREQLSRFIAEAKKELCIYDPKISDPAIIRLLQERAKAGVQISVIGRLARKCQGVSVHKMPQMRIHTRTIIRDGSLAFVGSQSLRTLELDGRREVGIIFRDTKIAHKLLQTFQGDWSRAEQLAVEDKDDTAPVTKVAKKIAKAVAKEMPPMAPVINGAMKELVGGAVATELMPEEVEAMVKDAVKDAVREAVESMVGEVVEQRQEEEEQEVAR
jgi:cardiolipin synthase A/B